MRLRRHSTGAWEIRDLHPLLSALLADLSRAASRHDGARRRLYPEPAAAEHADIRNDWKEHVQPGLERLFASSREIVAGDLKASDGEVSPGRVVIPFSHVDAWLNTLNQARLAIVEENGFGEEDLDHREPPDVSTSRGMDLLKVHFYAHLQELLVGVADQ